jgi:hypothetical protein
LNAWIGPSAFDASTARAVGFARSRWSTCHVFIEFIYGERSIIHKRSGNKFQHNWPTDLPHQIRVTVKAGSKLYGVFL